MKTAPRHITFLSPKVEREMSDAVMYSTGVDFAVYLPRNPQDVQGARSKHQRALDQLGELEKRSHKSIEVIERNYTVGDIDITSTLADTDVMYYTKPEHEAHAARGG